MKNKITEQDIIDSIRSVDYYNKPGTSHTTCYMILRNGFLVTGESCCVDPINYDQTIGEREAYKVAKEKVWELEGYALKQSLYDQAAATMFDAKASPAQPALDLKEWPKTASERPLEQDFVFTKPTVGRIVYYYAEYALREMLGVDDADTPLAALVVKVHSDRELNLVVYSSEGITYPMEGILLIHPGDVEPAPGTGGYCAWMPYQVAAAKKYPVK